MWLNKFPYPAGGHFYNMLILYYFNVCERYFDLIYKVYFILIIYIILI
jgi:hypothetical protein